MALPSITEAAATRSASSATTFVSSSHRWSRPNWPVGAMVIFLCGLSLRTPVHDYAYGNVQQRDVSLLLREVNGTSMSTDYDRHFSNFSTIPSAKASAIPIIANNITFSTDSETDLSFNPENIPLFMREYFKWHNKQLELLHQGKLAWIDADKKGNEHSSSTPPTAARFLIIRCTHTDRCGGTSDRLRSFPLFVLLAALSNRILLMRWGRPFALEDFMQPAGVWNWTVPDPLMTLLQQEQSNLKQSRRHHNQGTPRRAVYFDGNHFEKLQQKNMDHKTWVVEGNDFSGGQDHYQRLVNLELMRVETYKKDVASGKINQTTTTTATLQSTVFQESAVTYPWTELRRRDGSYLNFYHDLFHATFVPAQGVQRLLRQYVEHLPRHHYVVAHYRATYPGEPYRENGDLKALQKIIFHAIDCAHTIAPDLPIYVASDTALALEAVSHVYHNCTYSHVDTHGNATANNSSLVRSMDLDAYRSTKVADVPVWTSMDVDQVGTNSVASEEIHRVLPPVEDPPHLNFAKVENPSGFYSIFVDIFLMSQAFCVTYGGGAGAFGIFGSLASKNPLCRIPHTRRGGVLEECRRYSPQALAVPQS